jgi:glycosyltransferase involved in cell wall biosynthesis
VDGVHIYRLPSLRLPQAAIALNFPWLSFTFTPANQRRIQKIINQRQPDVIHLHNHMFDLGFSAVRTSKRNGIPLVITIHTLIKHPNRLYNLFLYPADRGLIKRTVIDQAQTLICPDVTIEEYVFEAFGKTNTVLIPYGIGLLPQANAQVIAQIKEKYHLPPGPIILSLGHVHDIRNRLDLIKAMPDIIERFPNTALVIAGSVGTNTTEALARKLGILDAVIFTGAVPHSEALILLQIADIEAHWFQENNPLTRTLGVAALEAMGAGKVVFNTAEENVYGEGVLQNGQNYTRVEVGRPDHVAQKIIQVLSDKEKRIAIGEHAKQTIENHFSWDRVCSRTLDLYRNVIKERIC